MSNWQVVRWLSSSQLLHNFCTTVTTFKNRGCQKLSRDNHDFTCLTTFKMFTTNKLRSRLAWLSRLSRKMVYLIFLKNFSLFKKCHFGQKNQIVKKK